MNKYEQVDALLAVAQAMVAELLATNDDELYGLLQSAYESIMSARGDLDADTK